MRNFNLFLKIGNYNEFLFSYASLCKWLLRWTFKIPYTLSHIQNAINFMALLCLAFFKIALNIKTSFSLSWWWSYHSPHHHHHHHHHHHLCFSSKVLLFVWLNLLQVIPTIKWWDDVMCFTCTSLYLYFTCTNSGIFLLHLSTCQTAVMIWWWLIFCITNRRSPWLCNGLTCIFNATKFWIAFIWVYL